MMPSSDGNNTTTTKAGASDDAKGSGSGGGGRKGAHQKPPEQGLKCPRCDSSNTKFCYYNNYSLSQPRHFCKTCRRYWTKGGALRNVPIGGGCRKSNKKSKSNNSRASGGVDSKDSSNYPHGMMISPSMDFQLGSYNFSHGLMINSSIISPNFDSPFVNSVNPCCLDAAAAAAPVIRPSSLMGGFSFPVNQSGGLMNFNTSLASSIESLSCINQDMHLKLQQQRLGVMLIDGDDDHDQDNINHQKESSFVEDINKSSSSSKPVQSISFQNLEVLKPVSTSTAACGVSDHDHPIIRPTTDQYWFFENSSSSYSCTPNSTTVSSSTNHKGDCMNTSNWSASGVQYSWSDLNQYGGLP